MIDAVDNVIIKVLVANKTDVTLNTQHHFQNKVTQPGSSAMECLAEHGLALSIVIFNGDTSHRYLFDMGGLKKTLLNNLAVFKIDPLGFEKVILSHSHYDHFGAVLEIAQKLHEGTEFILNQELFLPHFSLGKELIGKDVAITTLNFEQLKRESKIRQLPDFPEKEFLAIANKKNFELTFTNKPITITPGVTTSGEIPITDETEVTKGMLFRKDGQFFHDTFRDEIALYINVKGKGLLVLTGCGHCGLINTIKHGLALTGVNELYGIIGGLHQNWASPQRIHRTVSWLKELRPTLVAGMHCTGFNFIAESIRQMPMQTPLVVVGTTFAL
ncbi:MAG: MBL fold metallo-hydrolase [Candidatus Helarchaeota archaeon]